MPRVPKLSYFFYLGNNEKRLQKKPLPETRSKIELSKATDKFETFYRRKTQKSP